MTFDPTLHPRGDKPANSGQWSAKDNSPAEGTLPQPEWDGDLLDIRLNDRVKTAAITAAAGRHPTMFYKTHDTAEEVDHLVEEMAKARGVHIVTVPHTATIADLVGRPGEPGLMRSADGGILYIPEATELHANALDSLRGPLESGVLAHSRGHEVMRGNARFQLVMASNKCPCGSNDDCVCSPNLRRRYLSRISGPIMDRVSVQADARHNVDPGNADESAEAALLVYSAAKFQEEKLAGTPWTNYGEVPGAYLRGDKLRLPPEARAALDRALERGGITMRGYDRVLKVAHTIAAMKDGRQPGADEVQEAMNMRRTTLW